MSRKKRNLPEGFETCGSSKFVRIFDDMMESPAFFDMTKNQRLLFIYCKRQFCGSDWVKMGEGKHPGIDFPEVVQFKDARCFYFNLGLAVKYGLYTKNGRKEFAKDMEALAKHGFIDRITDGELTHSKSIYRFSSGWKEWPNNEIIWATKNDKGNMLCRDKDT